MFIHGVVASNQVNLSNLVLVNDYDKTSSYVLPKGIANNDADNAYIITSDSQLDVVALSSGNVLDNGTHPVTNPSGFCLKNNANTYGFVLGGTDTIYEIDAFGAAIIYNSHTLDDPVDTGKFSKDGSRFYGWTYGDTSKRVDIWDADPIFELSGITQAGQNFIYESRVNSIYDLDFTNDGLTLFVLGGDGVNLKIYEFSLSTAYNFNTLSLTHITEVHSEGYGYITCRTDGASIYTFTIDSGGSIKLRKYNRT